MTSSYNNPSIRIVALDDADIIVTSSTSVTGQSSDMQSNDSDWAGASRRSIWSDESED